MQPHSIACVFAVAFGLAGCSCSTKNGSTLNGAGTTHTEDPTDASSQSSANGSPSGGSTGATPATSRARPGGESTVIAGKIIDYRAANAFESIPKSAIESAQSRLRIFYGKLSHGTQLPDGMKMLADEYGVPYVFGDSFLYSFYGSTDPGRDPGAAFAATTRTELGSASQPKYNVVMWAFSSNLGNPDQGTVGFVTGYLNDMEALEAEFPTVAFIYFTGSARTDLSADGTMTRNNVLIRDYATAHSKYLYDFESLDLHSPDGTYYADGTHACEWCTNWCATNDCHVPASCSDDYCALDGNHTHRYNRYRKGQAFWYLVATLGGWSG